MSSTSSVTGKSTVELTPEPLRVAPIGADDTQSWSGPGLLPRLPDIDLGGPEWNDATLRDALQRIPAVDADSNPDTPTSGRSRRFARDVVRLGRLELIARVGSGGMGEVYAARDVELDRQVAVKIVRSDNDADRRDATARIMREAQMMARVTHPNVVRIYDVGRIESRVYITMEYVQGTTLREWLDRAPRSWREIVEHYVRAGRGLAAAHRTGLVHRDFKPSNVLVGDDDRVLVADFGLARTTSGELATATAMLRAEEEESAASPSSPPVTAHGTVLGTPGYMSPEQLRAAPVDARSDLFSFCAALYEALHGVRPYAGRSVDSLLASIDAGEMAPPVHKLRVPARVARAIARGLRADRSRRFATMEDLLAELERALGRPWRAAAVGFLAAGGLMAGTAVAGVGPFAADDPCRAAGDELAEVWNPARAEQLRAQFTATGLDFAGAAAERVGAGLDAYTAMWSRARVDACTAEVRRDQSSQLFDLRVACLERRGQAVRALVDALAVADRTTVEQSVDALTSLPAIDPCNDAQWLTRSVQPPESHRTAIAVARAREDIARADALDATGHAREGLALATKVVATTTTLEYEPVHAEALALRGRLLAEVGELPAAEATLLAAVELAEANRHDELAADVWLDLTRVANQTQIDPVRGARWIARARASQRRIGDPPARRVEVLFEQGTLHYLEHQYEAAERVYREAMALHAAVGGDARMRGKLAHDLAVVLEASGRHAEARDAYEQAVAAIAAAFGPDHPELARVLHDHATMLLVQGELDAPGPMLARCLDIYTRAFGSSHHMVGRMHISSTELALRRGTFTEAVAHAGTAARIYREVLPDDHPSRVDAELALGTARFFGGELESALDAFLAARELQRRAVSVDPLILAITVNDIAETQVALSRFAAASTTFAEVERLLARAGFRDLDLEARVLTGRGKIALAEGDPGRALPLLEAAVDLRRRIPDDPLALAELQEALIRARSG